VGRLSDAVVGCLAAYSWPGNVRELKNAMDLAAATMNGDVVELWDLPDEVAGRGGERKGAGAGEATSGAVEPAGPRVFRPLNEELRELEMTRIREALEAAGGVQQRAAELIGMPLRTLFHKMRQYGLQGNGTRRRGERGSG